MSRQKIDETGRGKLSRQKAFTLVELVIAIGIFVFAIVGVLGLFPVALQSTADAQNIMLATQIARTVMTDLRENADASGTWQSALTKPSGYSGTTPLLGLGADSEMVALFDDAGRFIGTAAPGAYAAGHKSGPAAFLVRVSAAPQANPSGGDPTLSQVEVSVEYPAPAPQESRNKQQFVTLLRKES